MNSRIFAFIVTLIYAVSSAVASDYVIAEGTATIVSEPNESLEALKLRAVAQAKNNAIIGKFGERNVSANTLSINNGTATTASSLQSIAAGEWLGDVSAPEFGNPSWGPGGNTVTVTVKVKGKIRRIPEDHFDAEVLLLRNGTDEKYVAKNEFYHEDDIFLRFKSPVDCYVAVYLLDPQVASCLLPYSGDSGNAKFVQSNKQYIFFSKDYPSGREDGLGANENVATYYLMADGAQEINELYVIYSKSRFSKALDNDNGVGLPMQLPVEDFQRWLTELRTKRPDVNLHTMQFTVSPK